MTGSKNTFTMVTFQDKAIIARLDTLPYST